VWLNGAFGGQFPITWSLAFIVTVVGTSIAASLLFPVRVAAHSDEPGPPIEPNRPTVLPERPRQAGSHLIAPRPGVPQASEMQ